MLEFFRRLARCPVLTLELIVSTFFITVLTLASPIFVIQVLNRFVANGFTGTLITLLAGMLAALVLQFSFRLVRTRIATQISIEPDKNLSQRVLHVLTRAKSLPLDLIPKTILNENINGLQIISRAYSAPSINTVLDAPFALLFVIASFMLSPALAMISLSGVILGLISGCVMLIFSNRLAKMLQKHNMVHRSLAISMSNAADSIRAFNGGGYLKGIWNNQNHRIAELQSKEAGVKELSQTVTLTLNGLMSVVLYTVGAIEVVDGTLSVGALIGANILAGRAFSSTTQFVHTVFLLVKSGAAFTDLQKLFSLPVEGETGTALKEYTGSLELNDLCFMYPRSTAPLFESIDLRIVPGEIVVIAGFNGSGKTTLARLIVGLLEPSRGNVLVDNVSLRQVAMPWWRKQIVYLPQEPTFINATLWDTIGMANNELDDESLNAIITLADLRGFIDQSSTGLETRIVDNGHSLPVGIRKRIALARALATDGKLVVLDEPTEGLDDRGVEAVYTVLNKMAQLKKTIIVITRDPKIIKGAHVIVDLGEKPVPVIKHMAAGR